MYQGMVSLSVISVQNSIKILDCFIVNNDELQSNAFRGAARLWPLLEPDVSVLGFPFPLLSAGLLHVVEVFHGCSRRPFDQPLVHREVSEVVCESPQGDGSSFTVFARSLQRSI